MKHKHTQKICTSQKSLEVDSSPLFPRCLASASVVCQPVSLFESGSPSELHEIAKTEQSSPAGRKRANSRDCFTVAWRWLLNGRAGRLLHFPHRSHDTFLAEFVSCGFFSVIYFLKKTHSNRLGCKIKECLQLTTLVQTKGGCRRKQNGLYNLQHAEISDCLEPAHWSLIGCPTDPSLIVF